MKAPVQMLAVRREASLASRRNARKGGLRDDGGAAPIGAAPPVERMRSAPQEATASRSRCCTRTARLTAETTAFSEAVEMSASIPTPHSTVPSTFSST